MEVLVGLRIFTVKEEGGEIFSYQEPGDSHLIAQGYVLAFHFKITLQLNCPSDSALLNITHIQLTIQQNLKLTPVV
jgi:hypothetical protein